MNGSGSGSPGRKASQTAPSRWVRRFVQIVAPGARMLDIACGSGRHFASALARDGTVTGIDRDVAAARDVWQSQPGVTLIEADLEGGAPPPFRGETFGGIIVTNYLWRPLLPDIVHAVRDDGVLIYETFAQGQERIGRIRNPDFLLRPGELLDAVAGHLHVIAYEHVRLSGPDRIVQRIAAVGRAHPAARDGGPAF